MNCLFNMKSVDLIGNGVTNLSPNPFHNPTRPIIKKLRQEDYRTCFGRHTWFGHFFSSRLRQHGDWVNFKKVPRFHLANDAILINDMILPMKQGCIRVFNM